MQLSKRDWLRLVCAFGASNSKMWRFIDPDYPAESFEMLSSSLALQNEPHVRAFKRVTSNQLDMIFECCERHNISVVTLSDDDYPERLREIDDPPALLFVLGDVSVLNDTPTAAVVGARDCCEYSAKAAGWFSSELATRGVCVVSGFARGIDTAAHAGALAVEGSTVAVLGCGILHDYPRGTMRRKAEIAQRGAVISEYLPTSTPLAENFKFRNRLITGLADCVLVAEAGERSGSLNSAGHAADQGKELFVLPPHDIFSPSFKGQTALLEDGAQLAFSPNDMLRYLRKNYSI